MGSDWKAEMQVMRQRAIAELEEFLSKHLRDRAVPRHPLGNVRASAAQAAEPAAGAIRCAASRLSQERALVTGSSQVMA